MKSLYTVGRFAIVALMLWLVVRLNIIDLGTIGNMTMHPLKILLVLTAVFLSFVTGALRWWLILRIQGFNLPYTHVFNMQMIATFSILFLPGSTAGDTVRAVSIFRSIGDERARAVLTVFGDRFLSVCSLSLAAAMGMLMVPVHLTPSLRALATLVYSLPFGLAFLIVLAFVVSHTANVSELMVRSQRYRLGRLIFKVAEFINLFRSNLRLASFAVLAAGMTTALVLASIVTVGSAYGHAELGSNHYALAGTLAMFANAVPLTPGGLGFGETAFDTVCHLIEQTSSSIAYGTIFLSHRVLSAIDACYGLIPLLLIPKAGRQTH